MSKTMYTLLPPRAVQDEFWGKRYRVSTSRDGRRAYDFWKGASVREKYELLKTAEAKDTDELGEVLDEYLKKRDNEDYADGDDEEE